MNERRDSNGWIGDSSLGERFPAWTRGNAADVFPDPFSPLGKSLVLQEALSRGLRDAYIDLGALSYDEFENPESPDLFKMFGGYVYNPLTMTRILGARMPGASPEMIDQAFFDERDEVPPYEEQPWHISPQHEAKLGESMGWAQQEFETIDLGDPRLNRRAVLLAERLGQKPGASIPGACENWAETAAAYRFLRNEQVSCEDVMTAHRQATMGRIREHAVVLCLQDTTELDFNGQEASGLGPLSYEAQRGLYLHRCGGCRPAGLHPFIKKTGMTCLFLWAPHALHANRRQSPVWKVQAAVKTEAAAPACLSQFPVAASRPERA